MTCREIDAVDVALACFLDLCFLIFLWSSYMNIFFLEKTLYLLEILQIVIQENVVNVSPINFHHKFEFTLIIAFFGYNILIAILIFETQNIIFYSFQKMM